MEYDEYYRISNLDSKEQRIQYGKEKEWRFYQEWNTNFKDQYNIIIEEDGYIVDFSIPTLRMNIDAKWKTSYSSNIAIQTNEVWITRKSVDTFQTCQSRNLDYHYVFVVHMDTLGWMSTNAKDIPTKKVILFKQTNIPIRGSGDPMYAIPLHKFKPLDLFLKEGEWNVPHKFHVK